MIFMERDEQLLACGRAVGKHPAIGFEKQPLLSTPQIGHDKPSAVQRNGISGSRDHYRTELRRRIFELIDEKSEAICSLYGCTFHRDKTWNGLPVLMNDPALTRLVQETATGLFGEENVRLMDHLTLGEDFAIYLEHIPGAFWVLGIRPPEQDTMPPLHNPRMSPDERALRVGISLLQETVLRSLAASSR